MAQLTPAVDDFAAGTPSIGSQVIGYLGLAPDATFARGRLADTYGLGSASIVVDATAASTAAGAVRRQAFAEDVQVSASVRLHAVAGAPTATHFGKAAVFARIQAATLTDDGLQTVRFTAVTCYGFVASKLTGSTVRFELIRWNTGTATVLATADVSAVDVGHFLDEVVLTLKVTANGADVDLEGSVSGLAIVPLVVEVKVAPGGAGGLILGGPAFGGPSPGVGTLLKRGGAPTPQKRAWQVGATIPAISVTDTGGSVITGPGRCGFAMDHEVDHGGGIKTAGRCSLFQVDEIVEGTPTPAWRDEWARAARSLAPTLTDALGTSGAVLAGDWTSDGSSALSVKLGIHVADDAAELESQVVLGKAALFTPATANELEISDPLLVFPPPPPANQIEFTLAAWWELFVSGTTYRLFDLGWNTGLNRGFQFDLVRSGTDLQFRARVGDDTGFSATIDGTPYLGERWRYIVTWKANANTGTGEGRVRLYAGRMGSVVLLHEHIFAGGDEPTLWEAGDQFVRIGEAVDTAGVLDRFSVFDVELTQPQIASICHEQTVLGDELALGVVYHCDFETVEGGTPATFVPEHPAGVTAAGAKLVGANAVASQDPGILPTNADAIVAWSQRRADSAVDQRRKVSVLFGNAQSSAGIVLRGSPLSADPTLYDGYRVDVAPGTPGLVQIVRVRGGVATVLAEQDLGAAGVNVSLGSYQTIEIGVSQQGGPLDLTGPVKLEVEVNDTTVVFVPVAPGASTNLDGDVVDADQDRILSGLAEGFHTFVETDSMRLDDWAIADLSGGTPQAPPNSFPNYTVPGEGDNVTGDLADVLAAEWEITPELLSDRDDVDFDAPYQNRVALGTYEPRSFRFSGTLPDPAALATFRAFVDAHGSVVGFTFDPSTFLPTQPAGTFFFVEDSVEIRASGRAYVVQLVIEERRATPTS